LSKLATLQRGAECGTPSKITVADKKVPVSLQAMRFPFHFLSVSMRVERKTKTGKEGTIIKAV